MLPVFRQVFAAVICRYVGIASPPFVAHTRAMHNIIVLIFALLLASVAQSQITQPLPANKQRLMTQAEAWVSELAILRAITSIRCPRRSSACS